MSVNIKTKLPMDAIRKQLEAAYKERRLADENAPNEIERIDRKIKSLEETLEQGD